MNELTVYSDLKSKIKEIVEFKLNINVPETHTNLLDLGLDSIGFIEIIVELENLLELEFDPNELIIENFQTIDKIYQTVTKSM